MPRFLGLLMLVALLVSGVAGCDSVVGRTNESEGTKTSRATPATARSVPTTR